MKCLENNVIFLKTKLINLSSRLPDLKLYATLPQPPPPLKVTSTPDEESIDIDIRIIHGTCMVLSSIKF